MNLLDRIVGARPEAVAAIDDEGRSLTYAQLLTDADRLAATMAGDKRLVLLECEESTAWLTAYVACLKAGHACLLLPRRADEMRARLSAAFRPGFVMTAADGYAPRPCDNPATAIDPALSTLLSTSGSTGSAKCVRLSATNMAANAAAIAEYLELAPDERGLVNLPTHYSYGLSIVNSHLHAGATLLFTSRSMLEPAFWAFAAEHGATSFAGVPHSYDLISRMDLATVAPPSLRYFTQAGGRLAPDAVARFATLAQANGWRFFVMYGQTEAAPRIAYLPPEHAAAHPDAIGVAVPGGTLSIEDEAGAVLAAGVEGELVYRGANVMMGYATDVAHLALGAELDALRTGDIARRGEDGLFRITGRLSRFVKIFGNRISLDEVERICADARLPALATGIDEHLLVATRDEALREAILDRVTAALKLPRHSVAVRVYEEYPLLPSGKVDYAAIKATIVPDTLAATTGGVTPGPVEMGLGLGEDDEGWSAAEREIAAIWRDALGVAEVRRDDTFFDVGGDSLSAINVMLRMEAAGIPPKLTQQIFEGRSIAEIAANRDGTAPATPPATRAQTSDAIIMTRALTVFAVFASHWLPFVLVRMGRHADTLIALSMPLFRFATPAFAMIYGVGLTFFNMSLLRKRPERLAANMRLNTFILLGGVAVMALFRGIAFYLERVPIAFGPLVYGVLLSYLLLVLSSVPVLRLLGARREPILIALLLALTSFVVSEVVRELWRDDNLSDLTALVRLLIVEKYGYFQMLGYALLGAAAGLWIDGAQASPRIARQSLLAGAALIELSLLITFVLGRGHLWFAGTATIEMVIAFAGAVLAIFAGMLAAVRRGAFTGVLKVPGRLLLIIGMLAFMAYVGHELAMSLHRILSDTVLSYTLSLVCSVGLFLVLMGVAMRRLYRLYYGGGA